MKLFQIILYISGEFVIVKPSIIKKIRLILIIYVQGLDKIIRTLWILHQYLNDLLYIRNIDLNFIMGVYIHYR